MPKRSPADKDYPDIINTYVLIVLIVIMMVSILGALAFPYFISPITYSEGGGVSAVNGALAFFILGILVVASLLLGVYSFEHKNTEFGALLVLLSVLIAMLLVWNLYGYSYLRAIFR